ncbi:hypothetical protein [Cohnella boryungensis]|uniref:Flp pilus-assembly TadG-like N-terminal domain-containing protein n=1 Tax=Cohnella boryungensis TaxID=768479 RepID=A0ABV8SDB1_9BACL
MKIRKIGHKGELGSRSGDSGIRGETGTVSIYFIVAMASIFLLTALLIDFSRIAAFRKQAELAVKSGVRSTLSSYDPLIYARYGLFIRGGEPANEVFRTTLEGNTATGNRGTFTYLDTRWEHTDVTESRPLATHDLFRRQILEEMKYKAPIDLALEVAARFRGMSGTMKEATRTVDLLETLRKAYDRREKALDIAFEKQKKHGEQVGKLVASAIGSGSGVVGAYDDYVAKRLENESRRETLRRWEEERSKRIDNGEDAEEINKDRPEGPRFEAEVAAYESSAVSAAAALNMASVKARSESDEFAIQAKEASSQAKQANEEMMALIERSKVSSAPGNEAPGSPDDAEQRKTLENLRKSAEDLVLPLAYFTEYDSEINRQHAQGRATAEQASAYASIIGAAPGSTGMGPALRSGEEGAKQAVSSFTAEYGAGGKVIQARMKILESRRSYDEERKQTERQAEKEWSGASAFLGSFTAAPGTAKDKEGFQRTQSLYSINREWNRTEEDRPRQGRRDDPSDGRDEAMSTSNGLMGWLEDSLIGARDQLFFSEYTMGRLSHFGPASAKELLGGGQVSLDIHNQEAEYILYGLTEPASNIAAAYGEIFAFRLAVRTMEGLIECRTMGHPLLVLAAALVYGITKAMLDMASLLNEGKIQLSKYWKVDTYYTDYLRLFLLAQAGSGSHTARMIAVMEHASGLDFRSAYTYSSGEATASVRLWFFPGLLKTLNRIGDMGGTVKGNRYETTYAADYSYL